MLPAKEIQKGPKRSCSLPPISSDAANITAANVKTVEVCARLQPNSFSSGATKTLQAYSVPSARFIERPPARRHQRLIWARSPRAWAAEARDRTRDSPGREVAVMGSLWK